MGTRFVALGGISYAAITIPKHSVGPKQLKANTVTSAKSRTAPSSRPIQHFAFATIRAYRIDCDIDGCTVSIGLPIPQDTALDEWFEAAMQGDPTAVRSRNGR